MAIGTFSVDAWSRNVNVLNIYLLRQDMRIFPSMNQWTGDRLDVWLPNPNPLSETDHLAWSNTILMQIAC